jgi:hypothetical protein
MRVLHLPIILNLILTAAAYTEGIVIIGCRNDDWMGCFHAYFHRHGGPCHNIDGGYNDQITSYRVQNGCCKFYEHKDCQGFMFTANDRDHGKLGKVWHPRGECRITLTGE